MDQCLSHIEFIHLSGKGRSDVSVYIIGVVNFEEETLRVTCPIKVEHVPELFSAKASRRLKLDVHFYLEVAPAQSREQKWGL